MKQLWKHLHGGVKMAIVQCFGCGRYANTIDSDVYAVRSSYNPMVTKYLCYICRFKMKLALEELGLTVTKLLRR